MKSNFNIAKPIQTPKEIRLIFINMIKILFEEYKLELINCFDYNDINLKYDFQKREKFDKDIKNILLYYNQNKGFLDIIITPKYKLILDLIKNFDDYCKLMYAIQKYPFEYYNKQIIVEALHYKLDPSILEILFKEFYASILNLIMTQTLNNNDEIFHHHKKIIIKSSNIKDIIENKSLKIINGDKYEDYLILARKSVLSFYVELKPFMENNMRYNKILANFIIEVLFYIDCESQKYLKPQNVEKSNRESNIIPNFNFPTRIFLNIQAYQLFKELEKNATKQNEIGFYFRQLSEKENPKLILVKEVEFREWYNNQESIGLKLNNPIKTYDRLSSLNNLLMKFNVQKELIFT